jgi:general stress protein 26
MADLRPLALDLLATADIALVTTLDADRRPNTRAMFNLRNRAQFPDIAARIGGAAFTTFFTTNTASPKIAEIGRNPAVSVYYCRPGEWSGLMLGGDMEIVTGPERDRIWMPDWVRYYPAGKDDPDHTVLRLVPTTVKLYHQLQHARFANEAEPAAIEAAAKGAQAPARRGHASAAIEAAAKGADAPARRGQE